MESHQLIGGNVQIYRRPNSRFWQCSASVGGKQRRASTGVDNLALARQFAEDWYLELRGKDRAGLLRSEKSVQQAALIARTTSISFSTSAMLGSRKNAWTSRKVRC